MNFNIIQPMKKFLLMIVAAMFCGLSAFAQTTVIINNGNGGYQYSSQTTKTSNLVFNHNSQSNGKYGMQFKFSYNMNSQTKIYTKLSVFDQYGNFVNGGGIGGKLDFKGAGTLTTFVGGNTSLFFVAYDQLSPYLTPRVNYYAQMFVFDAQTNNIILRSDKVSFYLDLK